MEEESSKPENEEKVTRGFSDEMQQETSDHKSEESENHVTEIPDDEIQEEVLKSKGDEDAAKMEEEIESESEESTVMKIIETIEQALSKVEDDENVKVIPFDRPYKSDHIDFSMLPSPGSKLELLEIIGEGTTSVVYSAQVTETGRKVAVKILRDIENNISAIEAEYAVLSSLGDHFYLPDFFGIFLKLDELMEKDELWIITELCSAGTVSQLVKCLKTKERCLTEMQIAFILKETLQALAFLHENDIIHRDVRASNLFLTETGDVRLADFGLAHKTGLSTDRKVRVGSPHWMAPEVVACGQNHAEYDSRCDVWSLGITALELVQGDPPNIDVHPMRVLTQTARNPPPCTLLQEQSEVFRDFLTECLTTYFDYRPYSIELLDHPFITQLPKNDSYIATELRILYEQYKNEEQLYQADHLTVIGDKYRLNRHSDLQQFLFDDIVCLDNIRQDTIVKLLKSRFEKECNYTYMAETLLFVNPFDTKDIYNEEYQEKYKEKSFTESAPHLYAVADRTYRDMMHQKKHQTIVLLGESGTGKSIAADYLLKQLLYLGSNTIGGINDKVQHVLPILKAFGNCRIPTNDDSNRFCCYLELSFSNMGKVTSAIISTYLLETERVTELKEGYSNFHIFYYLYEGLREEGKLHVYGMNEEGTNFHRYLAVTSPGNGKEMFQKLKECFRILTFEEEDVLMIFECLAAIILLGDLEFIQVENVVKVSNKPILEKISELLGVKEYHLRRMVTSPEATTGLRYTVDMSERAKNSLARLLYSRLFDWIISEINRQLSFSRIVYGDVFSLGIVDFSGFEDLGYNGAHQLWNNLSFEQMYYYFIKHTFVWEQNECNAEDVILPSVHYSDNGKILDTFLSRYDGLLQVLHITCRQGISYKEGLTDVLNSEQKERVRVEDDNKILVNHTVGKVVYDLTEFIKNSKSLSSNVITILSSSRSSLIKTMFSCPLTKTGQLNYRMLDNKTRKIPRSYRLSNKEMESVYTIKQEELANTPQILIVRQCLAAMLQHLTEGIPHFVFCISANKDKTHNYFNEEEVSRQLNIFSIIDLGRLRLEGFSHRMTFKEFLQRYQYLAFDFDETVDISADNCRICLLRFKLDGWIIGRTKALSKSCSFTSLVYKIKKGLDNWQLRFKLQGRAAGFAITGDKCCSMWLNFQLSVVFLKYYHVEYLSRLYETQVNKIIKVQAAMRRFLALCRKRHIIEEEKQKGNSSDSEQINKTEKSTEEEQMDKDAESTQNKAEDEKGEGKKADMGGDDTNEPAAETEVPLDHKAARIIQYYYRRWRLRSVFQVLQNYRMSRATDLVYFCQQVHLYNQEIHMYLRKTQQSIQEESLEHVPYNEFESFCHSQPKTLLKMKLPLRIENVGFEDTDSMGRLSRFHYRPTLVEEMLEMSEDWDAALQKIIKEK